MFLDSFGKRCFKLYNRPVIIYTYTNKQTNKLRRAFQFCGQERLRTVVQESTPFEPINMCNFIKFSNFKPLKKQLALSSVIRRKEKAFVLVIVSLITCYGSFLIYIVFHIDVELNRTGWSKAIRKPFYFRWNSSVKVSGLPVLSSSLSPRFSDVSINTIGGLFLLSPKAKRINTNFHWVHLLDTWATRLQTSRPPVTRMAGFYKIHSHYLCHVWTVNTLVSHCIRGP